MTSRRWYLDPVIVFIALLAVGPLAIPLVWMSPSFKIWHKIAITIAVIFITIWAIRTSAMLYNKVMLEMKDLKKVLGY